MKLLIVTLLDKKARVYKNPFLVANVDIALRSLRLAVNTTDEKTDLTNFPEDFALYACGTFDDETGIIEQYASPQHIAEAMQFKVRSINIAAETITPKGQS